MRLPHHKIVDERREAVAIAKKVLDRVNADPDDDQAIVARQFLRATECLEAISTDLAQDAVEDPVGFATRAQSGFYRIVKGVRDKLVAYLQ